MLEKEKRNINLDIIRCVAAVSVLSVHFFLNTGFYETLIIGKKMFAATVGRTGFMICVPLFIMLTGYLMTNKKLSIKYYCGIVKTLWIYVLISIACIAYKYIDLGEWSGIKKTILGILGFTADSYAWYIEMYIGLFLLIPFLNLIYHGLQNQKQKLFWIITLCVLTVLPSLFNSYNWEIEGWWRKPSISTEYNKLLPMWWIGLYPVMFYTIGSYIREFGSKIKGVKAIFLLGVILILSGGVNYYRSYDSYFITGSFNDWSSISNMLMTVIVFSFIINLNVAGMPNWSKKCITKISEISLGIYLSSNIADSIVYKLFNGRVLEVTNRIYYFPVVVGTVFILSFVFAWIIDEIYKLFTKLIRIIKFQHA